MSQTCAGWAALAAPPSLPRPPQLAFQSPFSRASAWRGSRSVFSTVSQCGEKSRAHTPGAGRKGPGHINMLGLGLYAAASAYCSRTTPMNRSHRALPAPARNAGSLVNTQKQRHRWNASTTRRGSGGGSSLLSAHEGRETGVRAQTDETRVIHESPAPQMPEAEPTRHRSGKTVRDNGSDCGPGSLDRE